MFTTPTCRCLLPPLAGVYSPPIGVYFPTCRCLPPPTAGVYLPHPPCLGRPFNRSSCSSSLRCCVSVWRCACVWAVTRIKVSNSIERSGKYGQGSHDIPDAAFHRRSVARCLPERHTSVRPPLHDAHPLFPPLAWHPVVNHPLHEDSRRWVSRVLRQVVRD